MGERIIVKTAPFFYCAPKHFQRVYTLKKVLKTTKYVPNFFIALLSKVFQKIDRICKNVSYYLYKNQEALPYLDERQDKSHWNWQTDGAPYFLFLFVQCAAIGNQLFLYPLARIWKRFRLFDSLCPYALEWPTFSKDRTIRLSLINFLS